MLTDRLRRYSGSPSRPTWMPRSGVPRSRSGGRGGPTDPPAGAAPPRPRSRSPRCAPPRVACCNTRSCNRRPRPSRTPCGVTKRRRPESASASPSTGRPERRSGRLGDAVPPSTSASGAFVPSPGQARGVPSSAGNECAHRVHAGRSISCHVAGSSATLAYAATTEQRRATAMARFWYSERTPCTDRAARSAHALVRRSAFAAAICSGDSGALGLPGVSAEVIRLSYGAWAWFEDNLESAASSPRRRPTKRPRRTPDGAIGRRVRERDRRRRAAAAAVRCATRGRRELTLCEDIRSTSTCNWSSTATIDGLGVRASDLLDAGAADAVPLYVVDTIAPGEDPGPPLVAGAAVEGEGGGDAAARCGRRRARLLRCSSGRPYPRRRPPGPS